MHPPDHDDGDCGDYGDYVDGYEDDAEHGKDERVQMKMTITGVLVMMTIVMVRMKMGGWTHLNRSQANLPRQPILN